MRFVRLVDVRGVVVDVAVTHIVSLSVIGDDTHVRLTGGQVVVVRHSIDAVRDLIRESE